ncbi:MAG: NnrS family protein [Geminicoccaceae bacterium]
MSATTAEQIRTYRGPAVLGLGFRPFFLAAGLWSALAMLLWILLLTGGIDLPIALAPVDWHVHSLLYGFVPATVTGFLLTAVPNWTGRLPVTGTPLLCLALLWLAGRLAVLFGDVLGPLLSALVDLAFLAAVFAVILRELLAGRNKRNLPVLALVGLLFLGNALFHLEAARTGGAYYGTRVGILAILMLIMLIGGRIVPSFTRNWLVKRGAGRLPASFGRFDGVCLATAATALASWVVASEAAATAWLAGIAGALHLVRLGRWAGERTTAEPLLLVLHVAYAFVPLGFFLVLLAHVLPSTVLPVAAIHAWLAGGVGLMTLAVMTRASLGHSGRALTADWPTVAIFCALVVAALARILAGTTLALPGLLHLAATAWILAFGGFAVAYWPVLTGVAAGLKPSSPPPGRPR